MESDQQGVDQDSRKQLRSWLLALYAVVCALALVWPVYPWVAARAPVLLLGLPFALLWNAGWILLTSVVVAAYHLTGTGEKRQ